MWKAVAAKVWGQEFTGLGVPDQMLDIGYWNPREGCVFTDQLFPHVKYGFCQLVIPVAAFHVSYRLFNHFLKEWKHLIH